MNDVLAVMDEAVRELDHVYSADDLRKALGEARVTVAELIAADLEYDAARAEWARTRDLPADAYWLTVRGRLAYAKERRDTALARMTPTTPGAK